MIFLSKPILPPTSPLPLMDSTFQLCASGAILDFSLSLVSISNQFISLTLSPLENLQIYFLLPMPYHCPSLGSCLSPFQFILLTETRITFSKCKSNQFLPIYLRINSEVLKVHKTLQYMALLFLQTPLCTTLSFTFFLHFFYTESFF